MALIDYTSEDELSFYTLTVRSYIIVGYNSNQNTTHKNYNNYRNSYGSCLLFTSTNKIAQAKTQDKTEALSNLPAFITIVGVHI